MGNLFHNLSYASLVYPISGFCIGVLVGMTGIGGGSLMTPLLILVFGVHPTTAVGTDLLFAAATKTVGTGMHAVARTVDWTLVGLLAAGSVPATTATLILLSDFDLNAAGAQQFVTTVLGGVLMITALFLLLSRTLRQRYAGLLTGLDRRTAHALTVLLGGIMGILVTATSVGAGAIGVTFLILLHPKMQPARVVGSDIAHAVPLTLLAGAGHWYLGTIDARLLGALLFGSLPGVVIGSYFAAHAREAMLRIVLAAVLIIVGARLLW